MILSFYRAVYTDAALVKYSARYMMRWKCEYARPLKYL